MLNNNWKDLRKSVYACLCIYLNLYIGSLILIIISIISITGIFVVAGKIPQAF